MDGVQKANSGHPGLPMAMAPVGLPALRAGTCATTPPTRTGPTATASSSSPATARCCCTACCTCQGYDLTLDDLKYFRQWGSLTPGHPERDKRPRHAGRRDHHRAAGPGLRQRRRHGHRRALPARQVRRRGPGPPHLRDLLRRRPAGGHRRRGRLAGRAQLGLGRIVYLYDNNHIQLDGPDASESDTEDVVKRFEAYGWHTQTVDDANDLDAVRGGDRRGHRRGGAPVAHLGALDHRVALAQQAGHPEGARLAAGRGRGPPDQGGHGLGPRQALLRARRGLRALLPGRRAARSCRPSGRSASRRGRTRTPSWPPSGTPPGPRRRSRCPAWPRRCRTWKVGDDEHRHALGRPEGRWPPSRTSCRRWSAAPPTCRSRRRPSSPAATSSTTSEDPGRNIKFGVREHGMGGAVNGMAGHGGILRPYGSTFGSSPTTCAARSACRR